MKEKSILITGAAGLIGSNLCQWILDNQKDFTVIALDNLSGGHLEAIPNGCEIFIRNTGDNLDDLFEKYNIRIIFHASAIASEVLSPFMRKHYYTNNIIDSANIINYSIANNIDRLVFFSSMAVYGKNETPFIESQTPNPVDPYGAGKFCIELDLQCAKEMHNLKWTIVRPHSVYGPGQLIHDSRRNVLGIWMRQFLNQNEPLTIYGDGSQRRAFTFIDDLMLPLWKSATENSTLHETFNLGNDDEMRIVEASNILIQVVADCDSNYADTYPIKWCEAVHEVHSAFSDHTKARNVLGLECKTSLKEGLTKMWEWAQKQPKRELQTFDSFELEVGLPEQFKK